MPSPAHDRAHAQSVPSPASARAQPAPSQALSQTDRRSELIYRMELYKLYIYSLMKYLDDVFMLFNKVLNQTFNQIWLQWLTY